MSPRLPPPARRGPALALAVLATVALTAAACQDDTSDIGVGTAGRGPVAELVDAPASVTARAAATLTAAAGGTLTSLRVRPGQQVKAGQVLAVIDSPEARDRLRQARQARAAARAAGVGSPGVADLSELRSATDAAAQAAFTAARQSANQLADPGLRKAQLARVKAAERRYRAAAEAAGAALDAVQRGVAGLSSAVNALSAAQRVQAEQAYDLAKSTVDALTLRAPIAGVIQLGGPGSGSGTSDSLSDLLAAAGAGAVDGAAGGAAAPLPGVDGAVPVGGLVTAGTAVLTVVDVSQLGLLAEVDETDVLLVRTGVRAEVELDAATGARYQAEVSSVDVLPTQSTRGGVSYRVRLALSGGAYTDGSPAPTPRPGMSAVAHLRVRQAADAVTVPAQAVLWVDGRDVVWAVRDGRAEQVPVTVGVQGQDVVQILSGVAEGQRVVVRGADRVQRGQQLP